MMIVENTENNYTDVSMDEFITSNKEMLKEIFSHSFTTDDSLLFGTLSLLQSRCNSYIIDYVSQSNNNSVSEASKPFELAQKPISDLSPEEVIDHVWIDIHHPSIKCFQTKFLQSTKPQRKDRRGKKAYGGRRNGSYAGTATVELRKLFDRFVKFVGRCRSFYFDVLHNLLSTYDIGVYIPVKKVCSTLRLDDFPLDKDDLIIPEVETVAKIVYIVHKCVLYIGDLSRYRTFVAKTYLPSTAISKADNNNYSKSIELYKLSLLILPSLGDPYNHIAIIDNFKDDKFNVVYNFVRSSMTSSPLKIGFNNLINLLAKQPKQNPILQNFESRNGLDRKTITKNDRMELLKLQFLVLLNYYFLPDKWRMKNDRLVKGYQITVIENDFYHLLGGLDFHKQIFNDFYFKQLAVLSGVFEMLIDKKMSHPDLKQSPQIISSYLDFMFRYILTLMKIVLANWERGSSSPTISTSLLPTIRLLMCWLKERELAKCYFLQNLPCSNALAEIYNNVQKFFDENPNVLDQIDQGVYKDLFASKRLFENRPKRGRLFKEDVTLKEFKPINFYMSDFDDDHLYRKDENATLALIGELPNESHKSMKLNDNVLRLVAVGTSVKELLLMNTVGITFDEVTQRFLVKFRTDTDLKFQKPATSALPRKSSSTESDTHSSKRDISKEQTRRKKSLSKNNSSRLQQKFEVDIREGQGLEDSLFTAEALRTDKNGVIDVNKYVGMVDDFINKKATKENAQPLAESKTSTTKPVSSIAPQVPKPSLSSYSLLSNSIWSNSPLRSLSPQASLDNDSAPMTAQDPGIKLRDGHLASVSHLGASSSNVNFTDFGSKVSSQQFNGNYMGTYSGFGMTSPGSQYIPQQYFYGMGNNVGSVLGNPSLSFNMNMPMPHMNSTSSAQNEQAHILRNPNDTNSSSGSFYQDVSKDSSTNMSSNGFHNDANAFQNKFGQNGLFGSSFNSTYHK